MKKFYLFFLFLFSFISISSISVSAETIEYKNIITDESTIEEDFNILKLDLEDFFIPKKYKVNKWYVVAMSESYVDDKIQTYFYLYNPTLYKDNFPSLYIDYSINNVEDSFIVTKYLECLDLKGIYKVKGFSYSYIKKVDILLTEIEHVLYDYSVDLDPNEDVPLIERYNFNTDFEANIEHSLLRNSFNLELKYNSTLIIEEYDVVEIEIFEDNNFINFWDDLWSFGKDGTLLAYFYNFNFPDRIKPEKINYAKFYYVYEEFEEVVLDGSAWEDGTLKELGFNSRYVPYKNSLSKEKIINEYNDDSKTLRVNKNSQELTFPTFYLGNRIVDKQFGSLKVDLDSSYFDYDCSVLLDTTIKESNKLIEQIMGYGNHTATKYHYTTLNDIELLELKYTTDGVFYKCQVVNKPVDNEDIISGDATDNNNDSGWDLFLEWFINNFPMSMAYIGLLLALIIVGISLFPMMIPYIPKILITLFKVIKWLILLPFKILKSIIKAIINIFKGKK